MPNQDKKPTIISKVAEIAKAFITQKPKIDIEKFNNSKQIAMNIIKVFEGCRLEAYKCSAGVWTIGYGHTKGVKEGMVITQQQAETYFENDIMEFLSPVQKEVGNICNANQIAALTSFTFNVGEANFKKSTLLKVVKKNTQNFTEIRKQFLCWDKVKIVVKGKSEYVSSDGLKKRRKKEADLFEKA